MPIPANRGFTDFAGIQVTLADKTKSYNLFDLLSAIDSSVCPLPRYLNLQSDPANMATVIYVGDVNIKITPTKRFAFSLGAGDTKPYGPNTMGTIPIGEVYVQASDDSALLNVEVLT